MTQTDSDDDKFRTYGLDLARAIERELETWVVVQVDKFWADGPPSDVANRAEEAGRKATEEVVPQIRDLLALDIDDQWTNPLSLLRTATKYPTRVLAEASVVPVKRDQTAQQFHPDDVYDLTPGGFGDLGTEVQQAGLVWGAAKAHIHLQRRAKPKPGRST